MSLRLVKGLVIVMSAALVIGFVALMVGLGQQAVRIGGAEDAPPFRAAIDLPDGTVIVTVSGAGDRLAVLVELPDGRRQIHFVDPDTGGVIGIVAAE